MTEASSHPLDTILLDTILGEAGNYAAQGRSDAALQLCAQAQTDLVDAPGDDPLRRRLAEILLTLGDPLRAAAVAAEQLLAGALPPPLKRRLMYDAAAALQDTDAKIMDAKTMDTRIMGAKAEIPDCLRSLRRVPSVGAAQIRLVQREIAALFDPYADCPSAGSGPIPQPTGPLFLICMTPRSGSTFLARSLNEIGTFGRPGEYFHRNEVTAMPGNIPRFKTPTFDDYIWRVIRHSQTANGVCGVKTDLGSLVPLLVEGTFARILPHTHFVYLTREDVTMQAISLARAQITGAWSTKIEPEAEARYSFERILAAASYLTDMMARWEKVFALHHIKPLRITYEAIDRDVDAVIAQIGQAIGLSSHAPTAFKDRRETIQRDQLNEDWRDRFLAEFGSS